MLPFEYKPWAKPLARVVIALSVVAAIVGAWYLYSIHELYIPEITGIVLLLLTIIPPNVAVLREKPRSQPETPVSLNRPQPRVP
jgi:uncharacterized membrane protein YfcA